jgi:hypothetical protein
MTSRKEPARPGRSRRASFEPRPFGHFPQPLAEPGVQQPQQFQDEDEADAVSAWLRHVEAGRVNPEHRG